MTRKLLFALSVVALAAAAVFVPLPWLEVAPGPTFTDDELATVSNGVDGASGTYLVTSVRLDEPSLVGTVDALLDPDSDLVDRASAVPTGVDEDVFIRTQRRLFEEGTRLAWAVGARSAGFDVEVEGAGAEILAIADVPAARILDVGDVITSIDGDPVRLAADVSNLVADRAPGDEVEVEYVRDEDTASDTVELVAVGEMDEAGLGVLLRTMNRVIDMPVEVEVADVDVVGPSGGLVVAVAAHDRLTDEPLADGRTIAGTGTIRVDGTVGAVGGTHQKVLAAIGSDADVFLVAADNAAAARDAADGDIEVVPVETIDDAVAALDGLDGDGLEGG